MTARYCSIMDETNNNPGPANYQTGHQGLSHSMSYRETNFSSTQRFKNRNSNPGVGDYQISAREGLINGKGSIGTGEREPVAKPNYPSRISALIQLISIESLPALMLQSKNKWANLCQPN